MSARRLTSAAIFAVLAIGLAALMAGCGSDESQTTPSGTESGATPSASPPAGGPAGSAVKTCVVKSAGIGDLRVTGVGCGTGQRVATGWAHGAACAPSADGSRSACSVRGYRCLGLRADRGIAVSCGQPGRSIAFIARRPG